MYMYLIELHPSDEVCTCIKSLTHQNYLGLNRPFPYKNSKILIDFDITSGGLLGSQLKQISQLKPANLAANSRNCLFLKLMCLQVIPFY